MDTSSVFIAHEFTTKIREALRGALKRAFEGTGFIPVYADDDVGQRHILDKIKTMIDESEFVIFDISNPAKPNVFLELGYSMSMGKRCYLICQTGTSIVSDLAGIDRIEYESYEKLVDLIKSIIVPKEVQIASEIVLLQKCRYHEGDNCDESELLKNSVSHYAAIKLHHKFGSEVEDAESLSGRVWKANLSSIRAHLIYGPYEPLSSAGKYRVFFKLKLNHNSYGAEPVLTIDICGAAFADRHIYPAEFIKPKVYQLFALDFNYNGTGLLEYRVYNMSLRGTVWVDYVAVMKLG